MEIVPESRPITHFLWEWKCLGKPCNHQKVNLVDKSLERMLVGLKWLTVLGSYDHQYLCWPTKWTLSAQRELYLELRFIRTKVLSSRIESGGIQGGHGLSQKHTSSSSSEFQQHMCSACAQRSLLKGLPRVFNWRPVPYTFSACTTSHNYWNSDSHRNAHVYRKLHVCTNSLGKLGQQGLLPWTLKTAVSVSTAGNILKPNSHMPARGQSGPSKEQHQDSDLNSFPI